MIKDTELRLRFWRDGSTASERLSAAVISLAGFDSVDPQSPLGGPDGKKDILCSKGGVSWFAACYFPNSQVSITKITNKFKSDLRGSPADCAGMIFITNQDITPTQRENLAKIGKAAEKFVEIFHLQKLQNILDSPSGYGIRLQYLKIPMNLTEQLAWFTEADTQTAREINANTRELGALRRAVEDLKRGQVLVARTMSELVPSTSVPSADIISATSFRQESSVTKITDRMSPELVLLFHRLICFDLPSDRVGRFRDSEIWLADAGGQRIEAFSPPNSREVLSLLEEYCSSWNSLARQRMSREHRARSIAASHVKLLRLHPFFDGNGRTARAIVMQQCLDHFGKADMSLFNTGGSYIEALKAGEMGNFDPLVEIIMPVIS